MATTKLYFDSELERDAYNAGEAMYRGCDMENTIFWYAAGEDENGYFVESESFE